MNYEVSAQTVISAITSLAALCAAVAAWRQASGLRFSLRVESLLRLDERFNDEAFRRIRTLAARALLDRKEDETVDDVLNFLDMIGTLVRRGALDKEMVWSTFYDPVLHYWHAAKLYVEGERRRNALIWEDLRWLYNKLVTVEKEKGRFSDSDLAPSPDEIKDFLEGELGGQ